MIDSYQYISSLTALLQEHFGERLVYVGLQGSYLRGEATEESDIDIMVVISDMMPEDLSAYREAIAALEHSDKSCGFICGMEELRSWNPLEICHLLHTTEDHLGVLRELVPAYTEHDVRSFVKLSLGNLYHEICHRFIHSSKERNIAALPYAYKSVFFILQNMHYLESGEFIGTKNELRKALACSDRRVLDTAISLGKGEPFDFDDAFELLYLWCREALIRTTMHI
ncbi:MAG: nucleotidyltransferase domain-containing protein [Ruminococcaceae bacterium]|nr:nucleotidyltransferase domain-containing protein [Oscillospiraceae bacterium]